MRTRPATTRLIEVVFAITMLATFAGLAAGLFGILDARPVSLIALIGAGIGVLSILCFFFSTHDELPRSY